MHLGLLLASDWIEHVGASAFVLEFAGFSHFVIEASDAHLVSLGRAQELNRRLPVAVEGTRLLRLAQILLTYRVRI